MDSSLTSNFSYFLAQENLTTEENFPNQLEILERNSFLSKGNKNNISISLSLLIEEAINKCLNPTVPMAEDLFNLFSANLDFNSLTSFTTNNNEEYDFLINQAQLLAKDSLLNFVQQENYDQLITDNFNGQWSSQDLKSNINDYLEADNILQIKVVSANNQRLFKGAFSSQTNTIYFDEQFLADNHNQVSVVKEVLIEELAHWWQSQNSSIDLQGDEGELLLALIENQPLTHTEIERIKEENDHQLVSIDGVVTLIEKASLAGTPELELAEALGEVIKIPGDGEETVSIIINYGKIEAAYNNEVGVFLTDAEGKVDGVSPSDSSNYANAVLNNGSRQILFTGAEKTGSWRELNFPKGSHLGFYLVSNSDSQTYLNSNPSQKPPLYFSLLGSNSDGYEYVQATNLGSGIWQLNWEDLLGGGDNDYDDVVLNIFEEGIKVKGNESQIVPLEIDWVFSEAAYQNEMGYYLVDTADGTINGVSPEDSNYAQEVFKQGNYQAVFGEGNYGGRKQYELTGGKYLGWYLIANNNSAEFLSSNPTNDENGEVLAYFSYAEANPDELNHLLHYSSQEMGWEDLFTGGDLDYDDLIFDFNFGQARNIGISVNNVSVIESDNGQNVVEFKVSLSESHLTTVTVNYATEDGTAIAGEDYQVLSGSLTFAPGEVEKTVRVTILGDAIVEGDEFFSLKLSNPNKAVIVDGEGIATIIDNDTEIVNNPPTISLENLVNNLAENTDTSNGIKVADIVISDEGNGINNLSLTGEDADSFEIVNNQLFLKANTNLNFEEKTNYNVTVAVDDETIGQSPDDSINYSLAIINVNEPPEINNPPTINLENVVNNLAENTDTSNRIKVADIVINDDGNGVNNLSLTGEDADDFELINNQLFLKANTNLNFEEKNSYNVIVSVDDETVGGNPDNSFNYSLAIVNVSEAPFDITLDNDRVDENELGAVVGNLGVLDFDNVPEFTDNTVTVDDDRFEVINNNETLQLKLKDDQSLDFNVEETVTFILTATDINDNSLTYSKEFIINVVEINQPPENQPPTDIQLDNDSIEENVTGAIVGNVTVIDPDVVPEFTNNIVTVSDNRFEVVNNSGILQLKLKEGQSLDYETEPTVAIALIATDSSNNTLTYSENFTINVIDVDESNQPLNISADLANDTGTSNTDRLTLDPTVIGQTEGATSLRGNLNGNGFVDISNALNDDGSFTVSFEQYDLLSNGSLPAGEYTLELKARNSSGQESQVVTVSFTLDWIAPPLSLALAPESDTGVKGDNVTTAYKVNLIGQTEPGLEVVLVETQQMVVADETGAFTFFDVAMPSAGQAPYSLVVSDAAGNQGRSRQFLTREGINGAPEITSTPEANFDPATQVTYAYQVEAIDPDGDELSYRLINAPSVAKIDGNGLLTFTPSGNTTPSYDFKVEVGDGRGGVETQTFTVEVLGVGEGLGTIRGMKWKDLDGNGKPYTDIVRANGNAQILSSNTTEEEIFIRLTPPVGSQRGSAFLKDSFDIVDGSGNVASFSSQFQFSITNSGGLAGGGDGILFVISPNNTASSFPGLNNSVAVNLVTFRSNYISIMTNGNTVNAIAQTTVSPSFRNGGLWNVWIDYNGATQTLEARVSQDLNRPVDPTVSAVVNIPVILNQEQIFVGLSATTGAAVGQPEVFDWDFQVNGTEINKSIDILPNRTIEPGLAGVTVYLDLNDNEVLDSSEPFQVTAEDDPNTPDINETGQYEFKNLEPGTYVVREIVPDGYVQTAPIGTVLGSMFDGDFNNEDWSSSYLVVSGPPPTITELSEDQRLTGGNPSAYRHMVHQWGVGGRIIVYHRYEDYTFDPSVRPFDTIDYVEDVRAINLNGVIGQGMAIFQGGDIFRMLGRAFGNFDWQTWAVGNLKEEDFFSDFTANRPDFSKNGAPMQFGYWRSNSNVNGDRIQHGIDDWSVTLIDSSSNSYLVNLSAGEIVEKIDFGNALAGSVNVPPRIVSNPITSGYIGVPYQYQVAAIDGNGDVLTYTLLNAPQGMEISNTGVITWATGAIGSYQVEVQVDDGKGGIVTQPYDLNVVEIPVDAEAPEVALGFSGTVLSVGETVNFQISGQDNFGLADLDITVNGQSLTLNSANIERGEIYTASFTPDRPGIFEVLATATDFGGNKDTETLSVRVLDPNDTSAPIAQLDISDFDPLNLVIREKTEIKGTINDENLEFYRVELAPVSLIDLGNPAAKDPDYVTIAEGTGNIDGILASIDPALYRNDNYFVRIYAQDINGNVTVEGFGVGIDSQTKPGEFSLEFTDLSIPLTGISIEVTRRYSSLDANFQGDFGYGWELGLQDAQIVESAPTGVDLKFDDFFGGNSFTIGTRVTLTTPDGRRVGFTFDPVIDGGGFFGARYAPRFRPDPGVYETLEVPYFPLSVRGDGSVGLYLFGFTFNPRDYILTTKEGTKYSYSQYNGLQKIEDRNGNLLTFSDDGIVSSTGAEIDFVRDAQGRITEIIDPDGKSLKYSYDANGNLIEFGDRTNNETTFKYESERDHYLTEIIDPLDRLISRTEYDEEGRATRLININGNAVEIQYDSENFLRELTDELGNTSINEFDRFGNLVREIDPLGNVTLYTYDSSFNLTSQTDPLGRVTRFEYDDRGNPTLIIRPHGDDDRPEDYSTSYQYDEDNNLIVITSPGGGGIVNTYDTQGNLLSTYDSTEGLIVEYKYDQFGRVIEEITPTGTFKTVYDDANNSIQITDSIGIEISSTFDKLERIVTTIDSTGAFIENTYDAEGRVIRTDYGNGDIVEYTYGFDNEWLTQSSSNGPTYERHFDDQNRLISMTVDGVLFVQNEYDAAGRVIKRIDALGNVISYTYDAAGRIISISDSVGLLESREYDEASQLISSTDSAGATTTYTYYPDGRVHTMTNPLGHTTTYSYTPTSTTIENHLGEKIVQNTTSEGLTSSIVYADGTSSLFEYFGTTRNTEAQDQPTRLVMPGGSERVYEYDSFGRLSASYDYSGVIWETSYNAEGQLESVTGPLDLITTYTYDDEDNLSKVVHPDNLEYVYSYDLNGNISEATLPSGITITNNYDNQGRLLEQTSSTGETLEWQYDSRGALTEVVSEDSVTSFEYDVRGNLTELTQSNGGLIEYDYDLIGRVEFITAQASPDSPAYITQYGYDLAGNLVSVIDPLGGTTIFDYDEAGRLTLRKLPNRVETLYSYDLVGQVETIVHLDADGNTLISIEYIRGLGGEPLEVRYGDGSYITLAYDDAFRLERETYYNSINEIMADAEYIFDQAGRRTLLIEDGQQTAYEYSSGYWLEVVDRLGDDDTWYDYDADGRVVQIQNGTEVYGLDFNTFDRLEGIDFVNDADDVYYLYDADGRRIGRELLNGSQIILTAPLPGSGLDSPYLIVDELNNLVMGYVYAGDQPLLRFDQNGPIYYLTDANGSVVGLVDQNGELVAQFLYDSYGNIIHSESTNVSLPSSVGGDFRFQGMWLEDTGLYFVRARYYDPSTGLFLSRDPVQPDINTPESFNPYQFVYNNSWVYQDPSGEIALPNYSQIKKFIALAAKDKLLETGGTLATEMLENALILTGISIPVPDFDLKLGNFGHVWEQIVEGVLCNLPIGKDQLYMEVAMKKSSGEPTNNGRRCGEGGGRRGNTRENSYPDFLVSYWEPLKLKTETPIKSFLQIEAKLQVRDAYDRWIRGNHAQFKTIQKHASNYQYVPTAFLFTAIGGGQTKQKKSYEEIIVTEFRSGTNNLGTMFVLSIIDFDPRRRKK